SVTMTLTGDQSATTQTDASGNYSFANLPAGGSYTVTPSKTYYDFSPTSTTINPLAANSSANFTATLRKYAISGRVSDGGGAAISGVTMTLSGDQSSTAQTDASGNYTFTNLPAGGSYTVTPSKTYYDFSPASTTISPLSSNSSPNFTATLRSYAISGRVTTSGGAAL